jgi:hypothetical protein
MKCFFLLIEPKKVLEQLCCVCIVSCREGHLSIQLFLKVDPLEFLIVPMTTTPINYIVIGCRLLVYVYVSAYSSP